MTPVNVSQTIDSTECKLPGQIMDTIDDGLQLELCGTSSDGNPHRCAD